MRPQHRYRNALRRRWVAAGLCKHCGVEPGVNRRTGRPYTSCFTHRRAWARYAAAYRRRRKVRSYTLAHVA